MPNNSNPTSRPAREGQSPLLHRLSLLTQERDTTYLTHGMHPYSAKFIPQLPRLVIEEHTNERHVVLDPFCGSGTTLVEAYITGRRSVGIDSHPIAALISRAKTCPLDERELAGVALVRERVCALEPSAPPPGVPPVDPESDHWFLPQVVRELQWLASLIDAVRNPAIRDFLRAVFSSIIVQVSNQESETRYAAVEKHLPPGSTVQRFLTKLDLAIARNVQLAALGIAPHCKPRVIHGDLRGLSKEDLAPNSIDLLVTSPPYPNSYDYYLYHKHRMRWLGWDPTQVRLREIGSRNEHSSRKKPISTYVDKMVEALRAPARALKPSKLGYFFIGDAVIGGELIDMGACLRTIAERVGLGFVGEATYSMDKVSRSFHEKRNSRQRNKVRKLQRVIVLEGRSQRSTAATKGRVAAPARAVREPVALRGPVADGAVIALRSDERDRHVHSIGRYPSKYIPDIPRWAIRNWMTPPRGTVLDPFIGSGTTAVESVLEGHDCVGVDLSPYAAMLCRAKTTVVCDRPDAPGAVPPAALQQDVTRLHSALEGRHTLPELGRLHFDLDDFWFAPRHLEEIASIIAYVHRELDPRLHDFFLASLSTTFKRCSYLDESQIKVKRDPKKVLQGTPSPIALWARRLDDHAQSLLRFGSMASAQASVRVLQGSTESALGPHVGPGSVDLVVTSPPYINAINYPMAHRYENLLLGLVEPDAQLEHQTRYYGSERVYARDYKPLVQLEPGTASAAALNPLIQKVHAREPKRAYIVWRFFDSMRTAIASLVPLMAPGARFVLVAGSNHIRQVEIDTFEILMSQLQEAGLRRLESFHYEIIKNAFKITRHSTANRIRLDGVGVLEKPA